MTSYRKPIVDQWYRHLDKGYPFQITAVDYKAGTVEVQHFDGDVDEFDFADWYALDVEPIEAPEDCTGPMDLVNRDQLGYSETGMGQEDWEAPLRETAAIKNETEESTKER